MSSLTLEMTDEQARQIIVALKAGESFRIFGGTPYLTVECQRFDLEEIIFKLKSVSDAPVIVASQT